MAFIRTRKLRYDSENKIVSGTAAIIEAHYIPGKGLKNHSKQQVREKLGKVIEMYSKKKGLFLSPTRGLVVYDSELDRFSDPVTQESIDTVVSTPEIKQRVFPKANVHTVFGDAYLLLELLKNTEIMDILRDAFPEKVFMERLLCHILHGILKDGSRITCDDFIAKSFLSYIVGDVPLSSLKCDSTFFAYMGEDHSKMAFFRSYVELMRKKYPDFGKACFVDSTPLPNDIDSPFSALCSHGIGATSMQMRLILILDESTLRPIWFDIIPGNILDINTLRHITKDVEVSLDIHLNGFYLDAGYASKELVQKFVIQGYNESIPDKKYLVRMPAKKGFPHRELYTQMKDLIPKAKYDFIREGHSYFGKMKPVKIFDTEVYAYVYVDQYNALKGYTDLLSRKPEVFEKMSVREKDWNKVKNGYFVLISNYRKSPAEMLDDYFSRTSIETTFKTDKEYLKLLPLRKWNNDTIRGKILCDMIDSIIRQYAHERGKGIIYSMSAMIGKAQSLMCFIDSTDNTVYVDTPNKQVKEYYKGYGVKIPETINMTEYTQTIYGTEDNEDETK